MPRIPQLERARGCYDVVFAVGFPYTVFSFAALRTARAAGAPLILSPFLHLATPGDPYRRYYTRPHQIRLLAEAETVLVQTDLEAEAVREWGIPDDRIFKLGMAVDTHEVTGGQGRRLRERLGIAVDRAVVGQLGALDPNKGTTDLVRAVERLNADRPSSDPIHLILAGAPSPDFEAFAAQLHPATARWLHRLDIVPDSDVPDFYDALNVFAMPSRTDSFGIVFLEAWANAKPVVAAAAGGVAEVVRHNETGLLVPFGDLDQLASAIQKLVTDPAEARRLGAAGRSHLQSQHTWDNRYTALRDRTLDVIARRRVSVPQAASA
jgi:glycosyltransferase involved in cell wall biosynthesis